MGFVRTFFVLAIWFLHHNARPPACLAAALLLLPLFDNVKYGTLSSEGKAAQKIAKKI
jgi:hypothetical protein